MKVAFDIHGVIDTFPIFRSMIEKFADDPNVEIHVVTGLTESKAEEKIGHLVDLNKIDGYFSVADYLESLPHVKVDWIDGLPWSDEKEWNKAKAEYCKRMNIDILFDDSEVYAPSFEKIDTIYCQIHNPNREQYKTRPDTR